MKQKKQECMMPRRDEKSRPIPKKDAPPSGSACRVPAHNLKTMAFPDCAKRCAFIEIIGAGECESACPWKFDHTGNPVDGEKLRQNARISGGTPSAEADCWQKDGDK